MQTLHPEKFDHGAILKQTKRAGLPIRPGSNYADLLDLVKPESAKLLLEVIRERSFENEDLSSIAVRASGTPRLAPKITPEHRHVSWKTWSAKDILARQRVLGRLWTYLSDASESMTSTTKTQNASSRSVRIILGDCEIVPNEPGIETLLVQPDIPPGTAYAIAKSNRQKSHPTPLLINTCDKATVTLRTITIEGHKARPALDAALSHDMMKSRELDNGDKLFVFHQPFD